MSGTSTDGSKAGRMAGHRPAGRLPSRCPLHISLQYAMRWFNVVRHVERSSAVNGSLLACEDDSEATLSGRTPFLVRHSNA